jgi:hypothetical protein
MKSLRLAELRDLLHDAAFSGWWSEYAQAVAEAGEARGRHQDLATQVETVDLHAERTQQSAVDAFSRAGDTEDAASREAAAAQSHENRALQLVGQYEDQRQRASQIWYRLGGAERALEERREALAAAERAAGGSAEARARVPAAEGALRAAERTHRALADEYALEDAKRTRLWAEVEAAWATAFEHALLAAERKDRAWHVRKESERLFAEAEDRRARAKQLHAEAEAAARVRESAERRRIALLEQARERFGCMAGDTFLYWRHPDAPRRAWAVSLHDDADGHHLPISALGVYAVGQRLGVEFLEAAVEDLAVSVNEGDRRIEDALLGPRAGVRRGNGQAGGEGGAP